MELVKDGWFYEKNSELWPGQCFALQVEAVLHHEKSKYQDILLLETKHHGRALVLDGIIQCTERDEFAYQEMMAFLPTCAHPNPKRVLIVGGGDGGVARDVARHPSVEEVHQVEIDERVVELCKLYLPSMSRGFDDPKVRLHIADGHKFLRECGGEFDVVITDSSDPVGPNASLFRDDYFRLLRRVLRPGGVVASQAGCPWMDLGHCVGVISSMRTAFGPDGHAHLALVSVPSYPCGNIAVAVAGDGRDNDPRVPRRLLEGGALGLRYYNGDVHRAAFALPHFVAAAL